MKEEEIYAAVKAAAADAGVDLLPTDIYLYVEAIKFYPAFLRAVKRCAEKRKEHAAEKAD